MRVVTLTPEHNVEAIVTRANGQHVIARQCDDCGSTHDPEREPEGGARYFVDARWLCVSCHCKRNGPVAT